jgi:ABC-type transport system involved in multi-copper enzyme maturation permease subunit
MSLLPVVDRELRVASRKWMTYGIRAGVGMVAMGLAALGLFTGWLASGGAAVGQGAFTMLAGYVYLLAFAGGVAVTADCLSSEKRDGTLGLLFLTDLKGYDIVLGKFAGLGLHAMYALVAVFPALALPLLTGGVTGAEFWRVSLALLNLLFVSLSLGMAVSAAARKAGTVFWSTLGLLLLLVVGLPMVVGIAGRLGAGSTVEWIGWISPGRAYSLGRDASLVTAGDYWASLAVSHGFGWACLLLASVLVPRTWHEGEMNTSRPWLVSRLAGERVARIFRTRRPESWLATRPILWLMGDRPVLRMLLWITAGIWSVGVVSGCLLVGPREAAAGVFGISIFILVGFGLVLIEHTCRFWVEARQNGNLEVLLSVPVQSRDILAAHWASIRKHFLWPLVLVLGVGALPTTLVVWGEVFLGGTARSSIGESLVIYIYMGMVIAWFVATFVAIGYTGVWLSLKLKRPQFAVGLTFLCVGVLPVMLCWLGLGVTLVFIFLPMSLLQTNLRGMILQQYVPVTRASPKGGT